MRNTLTGHGADRDDLSYFRRRASEELKMAYGSVSQGAAALHATLARQYQLLITRLESRSAPATYEGRAQNDNLLWHGDWMNQAD
jgi:hypothetical protein